MKSVSRSINWSQAWERQLEVQGRPWQQLDWRAELLVALVETQTCHVSRSPWMEWAGRLFLTVCRGGDLGP